MRTTVLCWGIIVSTMSAVPSLCAHMDAQSALDDLPEVVRSLLNAGESQDIRSLLPELDQWVAQNPALACERLLPIAQRGQPRAIVLIKRIAQYHHHVQGVADRLIPYFTTWFSLSDFQPNEGLNVFVAADFSESTKRAIRDALHGSQGPTAMAIRACGIAGMKEEIPFLKTLIRDLAREDDVFLNVKMLPLAWQAKLACARMGDKSDIRECIDIVRSIQDPVRRLVGRLPDIGYIRQPEAVGYLQEILFSDETLPLYLDVLPNENPANIAIPYATYAVHVLSTCIEGFPIAWSETRGYRQEDIAKARQWMIENRGKWKIIR